MSCLKAKAMLFLRQYISGCLVTLATASCALAADEQKPVRPASVSGRTEELYGTWHGGDRGSDAIYGKMKISESSITWKGNNNVDPRCTVRYRRIQEGYGVQFRDQTDNNYTTAPGENRHMTFLLKISGGKCTLGITHFRLTLDHELPGYLAMVEYRMTNSAIGHGHFFQD